MRRLIIACFLLVLSGNLLAQQKEVSWTTEAKKTGVNEYDLIFTADINKGWHVYSQFIAEGGPIPTSFRFNEDKNYKLIGKVEEKGHLEKVHDEGFEMDLAYFSNQVQFVQKVKLTGVISKITGSFEFMLCNDEMCLPPETIEFDIPVQCEKVK